MACLPSSAEAADAELDPKKKLWESVQPELGTDASGAATFRGLALEVKGLGPCTAPGIANGIIS